jgi:hypothetical protein
VGGNKRRGRGDADGTASIVAKRSRSANVAVLAVGRFGRRLTRVGLRHAAVQEQQLLSKVSRAGPAVSEFSMHVGRSSRSPERCSREKCEEISLAVTSTYYSFGLGDDRRRYRRSPSTSTMHGACLPTVAPPWHLRCECTRYCDARVCVDARESGVNAFDAAAPYICICLHACFGTRAGHGCPSLEQFARPPPH